MKRTITVLHTFKILGRDMEDTKKPKPKNPRTKSNERRIRLLYKTLLKKIKDLKKMKGCMFIDWKLY